MSWPAHDLGSLCFLYLVFLWSPGYPDAQGWWGHPLQGEHSDPAHQAVIWNAGSGIREQRQGPNFHNASQVTCPLISASLEEKVILKDCLLANRWHLKIHTQKWRRSTPQLFFLPHKYKFQVQNHSFTMYKQGQGYWIPNDLKIRGESLPVSPFGPFLPIFHRSYSCFEAANISLQTHASKKYHNSPFAESTLF